MKTLKLIFISLILGNIPNVLSLFRYYDNDQFLRGFVIVLDWFLFFLFLWIIEHDRTIAIKDLKLFYESRPLTIRRRFCKYLKPIYGGIKWIISAFVPLVSIACIFIVICCIILQLNFENDIPSFVSNYVEKYCLVPNQPGKCTNGK